MWSKIKTSFETMCKQGLYFPFAHDAVTSLPSVTLFFAYVSFYLSVASLVILHVMAYLGKIDMIYASLVTIGFFALSTVFYMLRRKLTSVEFDLQNKSIKLDGEGKTDESS